MGRDSKQHYATQSVRYHCEGELEPTAKCPTINLVNVICKMKEKFPLSEGEFVQVSYGEKVYIIERVK